MKILFALGNPENEYSGTRHNIGFALLDAWTERRGGQFVPKTKFKAAIAEVLVSGEKVLCAKPTTYYNEAGQSLRSIMDFYHVEPHDVLVIHDDLALPLGTLRTREGGSGGGNNGIKSINAHGGEDTRRLRVGIWSELRERIGDTDFVLSRFTAKEQEALTELLPKVIEILDDNVNGNHSTTTHRHST